jgi:hypothetical protein
MSGRILDEVTVFSDNHDATVTLYRYGIRVTVWSNTHWEMLYTEQISFFDYPDIAAALVVCDGLIYRECAALVDGLLVDGAAGMAVAS